ncbi:unnamed protein product [Cyprideis torosa]|uniref:Uncharacterized protein n=1 Tax=Cyprideis torosa TaxID=163714 RepID=A0A7R8WXA2_9CRUS|nr:unnamed protein product [Cyprideis torosa]CAG0908516.1 unnamed protein product [Cyprideis torosa]
MPSKTFIVLLSSLLLGACSGNWGWHVVSPLTASGRDNLWFLISGLKYTVAVSLLAIAISIVLGLLIALLALSKRRWMRRLNRLWVEVFRAVPLLVLLLWVYYGLPQLLPGWQIGVFAAGVIALALSDSAFEAEIFRAGIQSIDKGQHEAAQALGLGYWPTMRHIIMPQALRRILPPLGNQLVYMLKMSSLVSVIGMTELTRRANELVVVEYRSLEIYSVLVLEYLALILLVSFLVRRLERRMSRADR